MNQMDTENTNDDRNQSTSKGTITTKSRAKERNRSQTTPANTDINDPENLDYEDIDDNHQPNTLEDGHGAEKINDPVKIPNDDAKPIVNIEIETIKVKFLFSKFYSRKRRNHKKLITMIHRRKIIIKQLRAMKEN